MKHTEIPHELDNRKISLTDNENEDRILEPGDKIIYAAIRRYMNDETRECYPSIQKIKEKTHCGQSKIVGAIDRLVKAGFIKKTNRKAPNGKWSNYYYFPESEFDKHFEMFTDQFLDLEIPVNIKEYYMDLQQYLYDKESGVGKCYFSNTALASKLGISVPTVKKYNTYLIEHGFLEEETTDKTDEAGLPVIQKNFNLQGLNQAALWIKAVSEQLITNTEDIERIKLENADMKRRIAVLESTISRQTEYSFDEI